MTNTLFNRTELLLGEKVMESIRSKRIIIFGVGGVGSWCAECLVREGISHLTLVDSDVVCITNCNRQLMATTKTIGEPKVEALRKRLLEINPEADIHAFHKSYSDETAMDFNIETYDYVIDAIDSLKDKINLILHTLNLHPPTLNLQPSTLNPQPPTLNPQPSTRHPTLYSSMGAALRIDPTKVRVSEFWKIKGDPLAAAMRSAMRRNKTFPTSKFLCVHSEEPPLPNLGNVHLDDSRNFSKKQPNGSLAHITAIFGMTLAGLVIQDITKQSRLGQVT